MAKMRHYYIANDETLSGTKGTKTIDLPNKDYLMGLAIKLAETPPAFSTLIRPKFHSITKLEILDGSRVIQSLSGVQAQALAWYRGLKFGFNQRYDAESTEAWEYFYMLMGLKWADPRYMLDLNKLTSPQLKITWDLTQTSIDGNTYDAGTDTTPILTVLGLLCDGAPSEFLNAFVQSSQIHEWAQAASTMEPVDLPRTQPLLGIMGRGAYNALRVIDDFNKVTLNINNGEWKPFELEDYEIEQLQELWYGHALATYRTMIKSGTHFDSGFGRIYGVNIIHRGGAAYAYGLAGVHGGWIHPYVSDLATPSEYTTAEHVKIQVSGIFPHHTFYLPMSAVVMNGITLPLADYKRVILECTSGASASTSSKPNVVAEYLESNK